MWCCIPPVYQLIRRLVNGFCRHLENKLQTLYEHSFLGKPYNICRTGNPVRLLTARSLSDVWRMPFREQITNILRSKIFRRPYKICDTGSHQIIETQKFGQCLLKALRKQISNFTWAYSFNLLTFVMLHPCQTDY